MDIQKLEGIVSAIESEQRIPAPSHSNLARLTAMFCRALLEEMEKPIWTATSLDHQDTSSGGESQTVVVQGPEAGKEEDPDHEATSEKLKTTRKKHVSKRSVR